MTVVVETIFPGHPGTVDELIDYLQRVRSAHGNIPVAQTAGVTSPHVVAVTVSVGAFGAGKGPRRLVSRGGVPCLLLR